MLKDIQAAVFKATGKKNVTMDTDFIKDLKLNSFDIANITVYIEARYRITIPTKDLRKLRTVRDVINYLNAKTK